MITFQVERWATYFPEAKPLWERHWKAIAIDKEEIKLNVDAEKYAAMDQQGVLHIQTMRSNGKLVGYFLAFILPNHMHYLGAGLMAFTDVYYVIPEYLKGGNGAKLFIEAERTMKARGVVKAYLSCKVHHDHSELFKKLGWKLSDYAFTKLLKG